MSDARNADAMSDQHAESGVARQPGEMPCPVTGNAHVVIAERCTWVWHNRCEECGEKWDYIAQSDGSDLGEEGRRLSAEGALKRVTAPSSPSTHNDGGECGAAL